MTLDLETVVKAVEQWPVEDRRELIDRLADGLPDDDEPLSDELKAMLAQRLTDSEAHPEAAVPWDEVYARLRGRS